MSDLEQKWNNTRVRCFNASKFQLCGKIKTVFAFEFCLVLQYLKSLDFEIIFILLKWSERRMQKLMVLTVWFQPFFGFKYVNFLYFSSTKKKKKLSNFLSVFILFVKEKEGKNVSNCQHLKTNDWMIFSLLFFIHFSFTFLEFLSIKHDKWQIRWIECWFQYSLSR